MATPPRQWPQHAEAKRQEALELADENSRLLQDARHEPNPYKRDGLMAEARANNERIARLMETAKK